MNYMKSIDNFIQKNPKLKKLVHRALIPKGQARPRHWVKWFVNPLIHKRGKGTKIRRKNTSCLMK